MHTLLSPFPGVLLPHSFPRDFWVGTRVGLWHHLEKQCSFQTVKCFLWPQRVKISPGDPKFQRASFLKAKVSRDILPLNHKIQLKVSWVQDSEGTLANRMYFLFKGWISDLRTQTELDPDNPGIRYTEPGCYEWMPVVEGRAGWRSSRLGHSSWLWRRLMGDKWVLLAKTLPWALFAHSHCVLTKNRQVFTTKTQAQTSRLAWTSISSWNSGCFQSLIETRCFYFSWKCLL